MTDDERKEAVAKLARLTILHQEDLARQDRIGLERASLQHQLFTGRLTDEQVLARIVGYERTLGIAPS